MPAGDESYLSHINLKVSGAQASPEVLHDLRECTVENSLHLPDMCTLRMHDERFHWLDSGTFKEGNKIEVFAGEEHTSQLPSIFQGEITGLEMDLAGHGIPTLLIRCMDRSHRLHRGRYVKTFVQMTDSDIVQKVGQSAGFTVHADSTSDVHEWVIQNNQTNWEFLSERAHYNGYRLYVSGEKDLHFKKVQDQGEGDLRLEWGKDLRSFRPRVSASPQVAKVHVRGWDPKTKQPILGQSADAKGIPEAGDSKGGDVSSGAYGEAQMVVVDRPVHTQSEADALAQSVHDDIAGSFLEADGLCYGQPRLKPGMMIQVTNIGQRFSGKYFVTVTTHTYTPAEGFATQFSVNGKNPSTLLAMLNGGGNGGGRGNRAPSGSHIVVGIVTDNKDPQNQGRIKVQYPALSTEYTSDWVRICSPMAGKERGFYFLPEIDDEVLVAFEHGDIRRPYMLGALWNGKDAPVEPNSKALEGSQVVHRIIKTRIGHTLLLDDTGGTGEMSLTTKNGHKLVLDDKNKKISAKTTGGHEVLLDDQNRKIVVTDPSGNKMTIETNSNAISMECKGNFSIDAKGKVSIQGTAGIELSTPAQFSTDAKAGVSITTNAKMDLNASAMASFQSSGILEIQGSLVKIN